MLSATDHDDNSRELPSRRVAQLDPVATACYGRRHGTPPVPPGGDVSWREWLTRHAAAIIPTAALVSTWVFFYLSAAA